MKMEMSYRDKIVLLVVGVIVILVGGFFALIKPKMDAMKDNKVILTKTQETWKGIELEFAQIPTLKNKITELHNDSKDAYKIFINSAFVSANMNYSNDRTAFEMDEYLQPVIDESKAEIREMELGPVTAEKINYYYHTPNVLTYSLLEAADVNGDYAKEVAEVLKSSIVLSTRETAELMTYDVKLVVAGTKQSLKTFLDKIDSDNNAVLVDEVTVEDFRFIDGLKLDEYEEPLPGEKIEEGTSNMEIVIKFFNAKEIDQPNLGA